MSKIFTFTLFIVLGLMLLMKIPFVVLIGISVSMMISYFLFRRFFKMDNKLKPQQLIQKKDDAPADVAVEKKEETQPEADVKEEKKRDPREERDQEIVSSNAESINFGYAPANRIKTVSINEPVTANADEVKSHLNNSNQLSDINIVV